MLSKQQIDSLLQASETIVRKGNEQDITLLTHYVHTHLRNEELEKKAYLETPFEISLYLLFYINCLLLVNPVFHRAV